VLGFVWPKVYQASAIVYADEQNIIKPLLAGQAEVTRLDVDQLAVVRERLSSPAVLGQALLDTKQVASLDDKYALDPKIHDLQGGISVEEAGKNHFRISYKSKDQQKAFSMATAVVNAFVRDSAQSKRQESREAFLFIDNQVKTYKSQLQEAEDRLKTFRSDNPGGNDESTSRRISDLRSSVESLNIELQTARTRRDGLAQQLSHENQSIARQYKSDVYRDALAKAQSQLDTLRLSYQETYPDIVALKQQIEDLKQAIERANSEPVSDTAQYTASNPVYQKLKSDLAEAEVAVHTLEMRVESTRKLIGEEHGQSKENAEFQAKLAELTRDYNVTKSIYEDMLERREKARLSMALDVQGQGVTYKIKEPPVYPRRPVGLRFMHFFLAAPLLGILAPIGLIVAYIQLDPHIRFSERLRDSLPEAVPVLSVLPHYETSFERNVGRGQWMHVMIVGIIVLVIYIAAGIARLSGVG
jgi:polysaccharide chain length determinant protein (PEP-CTERM system associated)